VANDAEPAPTEAGEASGVYGENGEFNHRTWFEQSDFTRFFPSKMGNLWDIPELVMKVSNWENHR